MIITRIADDKNIAVCATVLITRSNLGRVGLDQKMFGNNTYDPNKDIPDLNGKVYVVTGGSAGIGMNY